MKMKAYIWWPFGIEILTYIILRPSDVKLFVFIWILIFLGMLINNCIYSNQSNIECMGCGGRTPQQFSVLTESAQKIIYGIKSNYDNRNILKVTKINFVYIILIIINWCLYLFL